jgi:hypothetical protein
MLAAVRQTAPPLPALCAHEPEPLHWSTVHGLLSVEHEVPEAAKQLSLASLQVLLHSPPAEHGLPLPTQVPVELQDEVAVQNRPSLHGEPLASYVQLAEQQSPPAWLPSSQASPACLMPSPQLACAVPLVITQFWLVQIPAFVAESGL